jgi:hypothetical protein
MEPTDFQKIARETAQANWMAAQLIIAEKLATPGCDPEFARKYAKDTEVAAQAIPRDKQDQYANLPVFHIHMHSGRGGGGITATSVEVVDVVEAFIANETFELSAAKPSKRMLALADASINKTILE